MLKILFFVSLLVFSSFPCASETINSPRKIIGMRIVGQPAIMLDHLIDKQERYHVPDIQATAWKDHNGTVNVTGTGYENYRLRGPDVEHLVIDPRKILSSAVNASDIVESHYNYHHWIAAPYTFDGNTIYALVHSEWYACLLNGDCSETRGGKYPLSKNNQLNSWSNTITLFKSTDGGASWSPSGKNAAHVVAKEGYYWTGSVAQNLGLYRKAVNHSGLMTPSRIIKEGDKYYAICVLVHRDFSKIDSITDQAPIDRYGYLLVRTSDITRASGWEAWEKGDNYVPLQDGTYTTFMPKMNGKNLNASQPQIIYDTNAKMYVAIFTLYGKPGSIYYMTTPSLARPTWSDAFEIDGTSQYHLDPRSGKYDSQCNRGFNNGNYISFLDSHSEGLNFEFTDGDPWLLYVVNPARCGGDNFARDLYRAQLQFNYE